MSRLDGVNEDAQSEMICIWCVCAALTSLARR